ncbi:MAG: GGDEF domain-containing protein, partial [Thermoleophilaceae bacterium]|nr:GGDEF domain-containing protein [Thermoleophilaceae bacterium]
QDFLVKRRSSGDTIMRALHFASERHNALLSLKALTWLDELTGLYNRRGFLAAGTQLLRFARRRSTGLWVVCADVEGMSRINETHGREAGDTALVETAAALRAGFRGSDVLGRLDEGEFAVLALDAAAESRETFLDRVARCIARRNADPRAAFPVALATGAARFEAQHATDLPVLLESARRELRGQRRPGRLGEGSGLLGDRATSG